ncbi:MAG: Nramp family divalent metal transporter, partial [Planctomycetaceae bacterium]
GPVVYNTVEKIQTVLVGLIMLLVVVIAVVVVRWDSVAAMAAGSVNIGGMPAEGAGLSLMMLLGALAFAGAGGTTNLGQSNYINDKGYGMGRYIGRITSPLTGQEEAIADVGYHFRHTPENMVRWRQWWRAANVEQFFSFFLTCLVCLVLLSLVCHSLFYTPSGELREGAGEYGQSMTFIWGEATRLAERPLGGLLKYGFLVMGMAILLTTELGVLDVTSRISADIVKVNWLRDRETWTHSRLYYLFLWSEIALGVAILLAGVDRPLLLMKITAALNGGVMFIYSLLLLYMNNKSLARPLSMGPLRFVVTVWSCGFFGYFTIQALRLSVVPTITEMIKSSTG